MQFLPVVERSSPPSDDNLTLVHQSYNGEASLTEWSVGAEDFGKFLITIFNEWVRNDVAKYYVQIFDATLANYTGENPGICVFSETCGDAMVMEHNGDLFSCDHFVYPDYYLGNITDTPLLTLAKMQRQFDFGIDKRNKLPRYCLRCEIGRASCRERV